MSEPKIINLLNKVDDDVSQIDSNVNQIYSDLSKIIEDINLISGTAEATHINNEYTAFLPNIPGLTLWLRVTIQTTNENTGPATLNINNSGPIPLKKSGGTDVKLKAGGIYTFVYDGVNFILQGEGGEGEYGTATAADVLAPKTIGTDDGIVTGTMPDLRGQTLSAGWYNTERKTTVQVNQPNQGMVDGYTQYEVDMPTLVSSNIKSGVKIFGVDGDPNVVNTGDATATSADILMGTRAYSKGQYLSGSMPNFSTLPNGAFRDAASIKSGTGALYVAPVNGYYSDVVDPGGYGKLRIQEPNFRAENIPSGMTMFGMTGTRGGPVKRVVRGLVNFVNLNMVAATISPSVNPEYSLLYFTVSCTSSDSRHHKVHGEIINNTTVQFYQNTPFQPTVIRYQVVEFEPSYVKKLYKGSATRIIGNATHSVSLPDVVTMDKCILVGSYSTNASNLQVPGFFDPVVTLSSSRELHLLGGTVTTTENLTELWKWQVLELN